MERILSFVTTKTNTWVMKTPGAQKQPRREKWTVFCSFENKNKHMGLKKPGAPKEPRREKWSEFCPLDNKNKHMGFDNAWGPETASEKTMGRTLSF